MQRTGSHKLKHSVWILLLLHQPKQRVRKRGRETKETAIDEMIKVFSKFIDATQARMDKLCRRLGREVYKAETRKKVIEQLHKISSLSMEKRLRAASLIIKDNSKVDLFNSLEDIEKEAWMEMLLNGEVLSSWFIRCNHVSLFYDVLMIG
ncbi:hypothetical protein Droror1_Dr00006737 [Drosera rotundifolia]